MGNGTRTSARRGWLLAQLAAVGLIGGTNIRVFADAYGLIPVSSYYPPRTTWLYRFAEAGGDLEFIAPLTINGNEFDADGLAMSPTLGMFAFKNVDGPSYKSQLVRVSPATGEATPIGGELSNRRIMGAAFDAEDRLWVLDDAQNKLLQIDPSSGSPIGSGVSLKSGSGSSFAFDSGVDLCFTSDGRAYGVYYEGGTFGTRIFEIESLETGATSYLGRDSERALSGLVAVGEGNESSLLAYNTWGDDSIFKYHLPDLAHEVVYDQITPEFQGWFGDLACVVPEPTSLSTLLLALPAFLRSNAMPSCRLRKK